MDNMSANACIDWLVDYALAKKLIKEEDRIFTINQLLMVMEMDAFEYDDSNAREARIKEARIKEARIKEGGNENQFDDEELSEVLDRLCDIAYQNGVIKSDDVTTRDLFDTKLMGVMVARPSEIIRDFNSFYEKSAEEATNYYYDFSKNTNYIRRDRIKKDEKWTVDSKYGTIDITINLSKPEKDPKAIAAARNAVNVSYPKCQLCMENEGYAGRMNHPARENHRIIPITIQNEKWGFQYSPYVYYNEHCIVFNGQHTPMKIEKKTFNKLFDFVDLFPHYFLGSNADLPIVGGSILTHDHFQGGHYTFAMEKAPIEESFTVGGFEDIKAGIVKWPLSVIRLQGESRERVVDLADHILTKWRGYTDEAAFIYAETEGQPHNTITPIARKKGDMYELDLTLRNNITTDECPLGVYHPHAQYHHIKKENIGLIEVMGLAVLPARLKKEMELLADCLVNKSPLENFEELEKHVDWVKDVVKRNSVINKENVDKILKDEIGQVFVKVLEDAGVYKCTEEGRTAFKRFIDIL